MKNLLPKSEKLVLGSAVHNATPRRTVVAALFNPQNGKFHYQYWASYDGLTCLLSGGVEPGESDISTLEREVAEETGYKDYAIKGKLGAPLESYYRHKDGRFLKKDIFPFFVELHDESADSTDKEEDEKFENYFGSYDVIIKRMNEYEQKSGSSLEDHKLILKRAYEYTQKTA